jgi:hypothetical protein
MEEGAWAQPHVAEQLPPNHESQEHTTSDVRDWTMVLGLAAQHVSLVAIDVQHIQQLYNW